MLFYYRRDAVFFADNSCGKYNLITCNLKCAIINLYITNLLLITKNGLLDVHRNTPNLIDQEVSVLLLLTITVVVIMIITVTIMITISLLLWLRTHFLNPPVIWSPSYRQNHQVAKSVFFFETVVINTSYYSSLFFMLFTNINTLLIQYNINCWLLGFYAFKLFLQPM